MFVQNLDEKAKRKELTVKIKNFDKRVHTKCKCQIDISPWEFPKARSLIIRQEIIGNVV